MNGKAKLGLLALGAIYCVYHFKTGVNGGWHFIDNVDLIIHEAGHFVFYIFGEFVAILGGSLFQLIVPLVFFGYFWWNGQKFSAATMLLWLSVNFFYVGVYAADALNMRLPLLGGDNSIHDWNYLLATTGMLRHTEMIARLINFAGFLSIFAALFIGWQASGQVTKPRSD